MFLIKYSFFRVLVSLCRYSKKELCYIVYIKCYILYLVGFVGTDATYKYSIYALKLNNKSCKQPENSNTFKIYEVRPHLILWVLCGGPKGWPPINVGLPVQHTRCSIQKVPYWGGYRQRQPILTVRQQI
jgi:hypothetical protein